MASETVIELEDHISAWLTTLSLREGRLGALLNSSLDDQSRDGYRFTIEEICQQPLSWRETARDVVEHRAVLAQALAGCKAVTFTGSGSSEYAGACIHLGLRKDLRIPVDTVPAGLILTQGGNALVPLRPGLLVSLARSGDSPESCAAIQHLLRTEPDIRHLVITCNAKGRLALENRDNPRVTVLVLDPRTNDRGLAMTSSFTNMVLAGRLLSLLDSPATCIEVADSLATVAEYILMKHAADAGPFVENGFRKALFLGSGSAFGAAREGALKMLELTAGRIATMAETPLGLRHGPMSWVDADTITVCFLSSDKTVAAYECDLLAELDSNRVGTRRVIVGDSVPQSICNAATLAVECPGLADIGDSHASIIYVLVAQLLAFFRSIEEGLKPDTPSESGVISRVVREFRIYT